MHNCAIMRQAEALTGLQLPFLSSGLSKESRFSESQYDLKDK